MHQESFIKILAICGSLRKESLNLKLLKNFAELLPPSMCCKIAMLHDIPLYNEDQELIAIPDSVNDLSLKILSSNVIVFGCPEYNYSIPGVLKNAIDWVSRHPQKPWQKKPAAVIGASPGRLGTARAQYHLRQVAVFVDLHFLNRPEVMVGEAHKKFDAEGKLTDQATIEQLKKLVEAIRKIPH